MPEVLAINYRLEDFMEVMRRAEPQGLDFVFDGMGSDYIDRAHLLLRRGGMLVTYGNPLSLRGVLRLLARALMVNLLPGGRKLKGYRADAALFHRQPFLGDWAILFRLHEVWKIRPVIGDRIPLLEAAQANALLENWKVAGNLVLVAPNLTRWVHHRQGAFPEAEILEMR